MHIKVDNKLLIALFIISMLNRWLILLLLVYLIYKGYYSLKYCIEGLLIISFRTILGTTIAADIGSVQIFKWLTIFILSFFIFIKSNNIKYSITDFLLIVFSIYICLVSLVNSSYPIVSIFKCISYAFVFWMILRGVRATSANVNWIIIIYKYMTILFLLCFASLPFSFAYYSSAHWFAGITNQSNMFGILAGLYIGIIFTKMLMYNSRLFDWFMFLITFIMEWLSNSRTGMLSILLSVLLFLIISSVKYKRYYYLLIIGIGILLVFITGTNEIIWESINAFIFKGSQLNDITTNSVDNIFSSREGQFETFLLKFSNNPIIGSGFCVPFIPDMTYWIFSFGIIVEPGNIVYAVLGDLGILGAILWLLLYGYIFIKGFSAEKIFLFLSPITISFGEMVFFSTNNIAMILYVMISAYLVTKMKDSKLRNKE